MVDGRSPAGGKYDRFGTTGKLPLKSQDIIMSLSTSVKYTYGRPLMEVVGSIFRYGLSATP